jgi:hypothetical protein
MSSEVFGSIPICPEIYMVPLNILAVEYGPIALGPLVVLKVLMKLLIGYLIIFNRLFIN